ncbi:hypothetical protein [Streptomyces luteireticuli]|uniref:hypothetical protein n=1 Tax=Streptomyces luteireticuli TaxID=173858 RepID=UPI0035560797
MRQKIFVAVAATGVLLAGAAGAAVAAPAQEATATTVTVVGKQQTQRHGTYGPYRDYRSCYKAGEWGQRHGYWHSFSCDREYDQYRHVYWWLYTW